ncbi:MAG: GNAT family N-acetyltransferase [Humidesulfovibrio sp.]|nr:GNAT family N-acetyltransferase [Humidesulfovibrio sp.]
MPEPRPRLDQPFRFTPTTNSAFKNVLLSALSKPLTKMLRLDTLNTMYARAHNPAPFLSGGPGVTPGTPTDEEGRSEALARAREFLNRALVELRVGADIAETDLKNVPATGPLVVVSNHPFGVVEGLVLAKLLLAVRPDVKILANHLLSAIPEMRPLLIEIDAFGGSGAKTRNMAGLRAALFWLKKGGAIVAFPAGEVSSLALKKRMVADPPWQKGVAALVRKAGAPVLPVFFQGRNGALFQAAGLVHPRLRTLLLPRENLGQCGQSLRLSIGAPIASEKLAAIVSDDETSAYMRFRCHLLRSRGRKEPREKGWVASRKARRTEKALAAPRPQELRLREIAQLRPEQILVESTPFMVFEAAAAEIPAILHEVARLRESTFRSVGEGTGESLDTDAYDARYRHLILWNVRDQELAGAYRFAGTDEIMRAHGAAGLYTASQFRIKETFWNRLGPALELGRSFVRTRYQKSYQPLLLMWKGLAEYVCRNPRYRVLFGCVSISGDYSVLARELMMQFLRRHSFDAGLARLVKPTRPPRERQLSRLDVCVPDTVFRDPGDLNDLVAELEQGRGIPVLLRQYLKLGGRIAAFNVDPDFGNCLDGLICVDLALTDERTLARFMGQENARRFLARHVAARIISPRAA